MTDLAPNLSYLQTIMDALEHSAAPEAVAWIREGIDVLSSVDGWEDALAPRFTGASHRLGQDVLSDRPRRLNCACGSIELAAWSRGDAGRACLLVSAVGDARPSWESVVRRLFRHGDESERVAVVRALCLLPDPCALTDIALEAGRANSLCLYAALALDNPFPAACYDDHTFNQVVLKCLFNGLSVGRIIDLTDRANPELARMCEDYRDERVAAGRSVPHDIWLALEPHASPRGLALIFDALHDKAPEHRYNAVLALTRRRSEPHVAQALSDRLTREDNPELRRLLESAAA